MNRETGRKFLTAGIVLAVVGIIFTVFSADIVIGLGIRVEQTGILSVVSILSRIFMFFGLPLAAGFICLGVAFRVGTTPDQAVFEQADPSDTTN